MPIISVEIIKITNERETQKKQKTKNNNKTNKQTKKTEKNKRNESYSERVRPKWFYCAFELGFLRLICKAPLIFKSNLELALSIVFEGCVGV